MPHQNITSFQNHRIKQANKLINKREREKTGLFLIDDSRDLSRALDHGFHVAFAFYCEQLATDEDRARLARLDESNIYDVNPDLIAKASYRQNPGALVAVLHQQPPRTLTDALQDDSHNILALVDLRKPGNIGALLRTADAAGFTMICLIDIALDLYNPNIVRSSTGACFLPNIYQMTGAEAQSFFYDQQITMVAAHLEGTTTPFDFDFTANRTAILLGTEDQGLEDSWVTICDDLIKIPMVGQLSDSLNVSVSGAICMYEALRQHTRHKQG